MNWRADAEQMLDYMRMAHAAGRRALARRNINSRSRKRIRLATEQLQETISLTRSSFREYIEQSK